MKPVLTIRTLALAALLLSGASQTASAEEASLQSFFESFDNKTFVATAGYCDLHLEIVSIDRAKGEATFLITDGIADETNAKYEGKCSHPSQTYNLYACNGSSSVVVCDRNGKCFWAQDEVREQPHLFLIRDGRIACQYGSSLQKLWRSWNSTYWTCSR